MPTLLLMRHAQAVDVMPGHRDHDRPLTEHGREQATRAAARLREAGITVTAVLASSAIRTRQTAELTAPGTTVEVSEAIYQGTPDEIAGAIGLTEATDTLLVVGHAPGIPALVEELTGAAASHPELGRGFPTATVCRLAIDGPMGELTAGRLTDVWLHR